MKTFYIFKIKKDFINTAKKDPLSIYIILKSILNHNKLDIESAFNTFDSICISINKAFFNSYIFDILSNADEYSKFKNVHMYYDYLSGESSKITINKCYAKIKSNIKENTFLKIIKNISNLFIVNFDENEYLFTGSYIKLVNSMNI